MKTILVSVLLLMLCVTTLLVSGCKHTEPIRHVTVVPAITLIGKSPNEIFSLINENFKHFSTLQASGEFEVKDLLANTYHKCSCLLLIKGNDTLLIKGYQPLIPNYFTFIIKNGTFTYYIPRNDIAYQGKISALHENKDYTLSLNPELMLTAFSPHSFSSEKHEIQPHGNNLFYVTEMKYEGMVSTIAKKYEFKTNSTLPKKIEILDSNGVITATIAFTKPTISGDIAYSKEISISSPQQQTELHFRFTKLLFNRELPDRLFDVNIPEGVTIEEIKK